MSFIRKYEAFRKLIDFECTFNKEATVNAQEVIGKCARLIGCMDNAEVQPVKHGRWENTNTPNQLRCSKCEVIHFIAQYPHGEVNFCPNCGAKMDGDSE